jgi:butyrate kinase
VDPCVVDPMGPSSQLEGIQLSKKNFFKALGDKTYKKKLNYEKKNIDSSGTQMSLTPSV